MKIAVSSTLDYVAVIVVAVIIIGTVVIRIARALYTFIAQSIISSFTSPQNVYTIHGLI